MSQLHRIAGCDNPLRQADVIFIHGLGGDAFGTWRHGPDEASSWPHWLGADFPNIGVWSLGYAASHTRLAKRLRLFGRGTRDSGYSMALPDRALQVLDLMTQQNLGQRPLVLVCHSLGGLLAKQLLRKAKDSKLVPEQAIAERTRAVLFLATPHAGADLATLLHAFRVATGATISIEDLRAHNAHLRDLFDWYRVHAPSLGIETASYYELRPMYDAATIVNPSSAHPGVGRPPVGLDEDHSSIAKPRNREAQVWCALRELLTRHKLDVAKPLTLTPDVSLGTHPAAFGITAPSSRLLCEPTFKDHCVVNPAWLATASMQSNSARPFVWHRKIQLVLDLITINAENLDRNFHLYGGSKNSDLPAEVSTHKNSFFRYQVFLDEILRQAEASYPALLARLEMAPQELRTRAVHTYAAAAALRLIKILQRFEGRLFTQEGRMVLRLFPDLPDIRNQRGPMVGLPYHHPVNAMAYGWEADNGFVSARICRGTSESSYEYFSLPRFSAEACQDQRPGPVHMYYGWVVPQWLLFREDPVPEVSGWWVSALSDEKGNERWSTHSESPWSRPNATTLVLPSPTWSNDRIELIEVMPDLPCLVQRSTAANDAATPRM